MSTLHLQPYCIQWWDDNLANDCLIAVRSLQSEKPNLMRTKVYGRPGNVFFYAGTFTLFFYIAFPLLEMNLKLWLVFLCSYVFLCSLLFHLFNHLLCVWIPEWFWYCIFLTDRWIMSINTSSFMLMKSCFLDQYLEYLLCFFDIHCSFCIEIT